MWKKINIENNSTYSISDKGIIRNDVSGKVLKNCIGTDGYYKISLYIAPGIRGTYRVNRLVALTYIPNPNNLEQVNHLDGNKLNNSVDNLEWCDASRNVSHSYETKLNNNSNFILVKDLETGKVTEWRSIKLFCKFLNINLSTLVPLIKNSYRNPVLNRYIITIINEDELFEKSNTLNFGNSVYVYDRISEELKEYPSLSLATYHTGVRSIRDYNGYLEIIGYVFTKDISKIDFEKEIDKDKVFKTRETYLLTPYRRYQPGCKLYDYCSQSEFIFQDYNKALEFIKIVYPESKEGTVAGLLAAITKSNDKNTSWIYRGFGIQHISKSLDWEPARKEMIIASLFGNPFEPVYKVATKNGNKIVIGNNELVKIKGDLDILEIKRLNEMVY